MVLPVSATTDQSVLDADDLSPAQEALLELLVKGRITAPYAADELGYSLQYCREELTDLVKHDHVHKVYDGLYELVDDPREDDENG